MKKLRHPVSFVLLALVHIAVTGCDSDEAPVDNPTSRDPQQTLSCGSALLHSIAHNLCEAMDANGDGACYCASMGWTWNGATCVELPAGFCSCKGGDCDKLASTQEECLATHADCASEKIVACASMERFEKVHDGCDAMDVRGEGACFCTSMGWVWDGAECVELPAGICHCKGEDCDKLTATKEECVAAHIVCQ